MIWIIIVGVVWTSIVVLVCAVLARGKRIDQEVQQDFHEYMRSDNDRRQVPRLRS